jgi:hypothetical protein
MGASERVWSVCSSGRAVGRSLTVWGRMLVWARMLPASALAFVVLGALLLVAAALPTPAAASARQPHDPLPPGSVVTMYPTYPSASDAGTPNGLASVGQSTNASINIPQTCGNPCWTDQGYYIDVSLVEVHHEGATCAASSPNTRIARTLDGSGNALAISGGTQAWPANATSTAYGSPYYALCTHVEIPTGSPLSVPDYFTGGIADINTTNHIYKVISDYAPTATLSATTVAPGQTLTVTGHNWIPVYPDQPNTLVGVSLYEIPYAGYEIDYAHTQAQVDATGSFSVSFPITSAYTPGLYYYAAVGSINVHIFDQNGRIGALRFQVVASQGSGGGPVGSAPPTATAIANSTASPTTLATGTASPAATSAAGSAGHDATQPPAAPDSPWPGILLAAGGVLLLGGGGVAAYFLVQTRKRARRRT